MMKKKLFGSKIPRTQNFTVLRNLYQIKLNSYVSVNLWAGINQASFSCKTEVTLKVSKVQNEFMMSSFLPKNKRNVLRISALDFKKCSNQNTLLYNYVKQPLISDIKCLYFFDPTSFQRLGQKSLKKSFVFWEKR